MPKIWLVIVCVFISLCAVDVFSKELSSSVILTVSGTCTEMLCGLNKPCCNSCQFSGWEIEGDTFYTKVTFKSNNMPTCRLNGCGDCSFYLQTKGNYSPDRKEFIVTEWQKHKKLTKGNN